MLQKTKLLGDKKKNLNVVVSLVFALLVVIPHVTGNYRGWLGTWDPVDIINRALPAVSIVVIAILMLLLLIGLFGGEARMFGVAFRGWVVLISVIIILWIFGASAGWWWGWNWVNNLFGSDSIAIILILVVFGLIIAFITGGDKEREERTTLNRFSEDLRNIFGGKKE
jgi:uncharacterized membrane protein